MPQNLQQSGGPTPTAVQRPPAAAAAVAAASAYPGADYKNPQGTGYQNAFAGYEIGGGGGYQTAGATNGFRIPQTGGGGGGGYSPFQDPGFAAAAAVTAGYRFPATGGGGGGEQLSPDQAYALHNYDFSQLAASQEYGRQPGFPSQPAPYSLENFGERPDSAASGSDEHRPEARHGVPGKRTGESRFPAAAATAADADFFLPPAVAGSAEQPNGRGASDDRRDSYAGGDSIAPLKYHSDSSSAEDQARLKETVQRFFSMLQKKPCERQIHVSRSVREPFGRRKIIF